jgi:hypothetical protein
MEYSSKNDWSAVLCNSMGGSRNTIANELNVVAYACNPSTQKPQVEGSGVQGQTGLLSA